MLTDLEEIKSIIEAADAIQARLNKLEARRSFTLDQQIAVRDAANCVRGLTDYQLSLLRKQFDPEYASEMERLTQAARAGSDGAKRNET